MPEPRTILVPVFLAAQALLVHWVASGERPPPAPDLSTFPTQVGDWKQLREDPIAADIAGQLGADRVLSRTYIQSSTGSVASLFVAWFQSQRAGASQPHSPNVCLPGSGWTPETTGEISLQTQAGTIPVNRYVVIKAPERAVVLYWYQSPRRAIAGEWEAKFWLISDALRDKRTDTALVRIVTWSAGAHDDLATAQATDFARSLYPLLRTRLPR